MIGKCQPSKTIWTGLEYLSLPRAFAHSHTLTNRAPREALVFYHDEFHSHVQIEISSRLKSNTSITKEKHRKDRRISSEIIFFFPVQSFESWAVTRAVPENADTVLTREPLTNNNIVLSPNGCWERRQGFCDRNAGRNSQARCFRSVAKPDARLLEGIVIKRLRTWTWPVPGVNFFEKSHAKNRCNELTLS